MRLCVGHQHTILADSGPFHGLLLTVSGPKVISTTYEPWGAFTCRSSTLTFLADSGPFRALLLTVLGPRTISTIDDPRGAFYVSVVNTNSFGKF